MTIVHQRFAFDTVFDDVGGVASAPVRPKKTYTPEEVASERAQAHAEGQRSVVAQAEMAAAAALADIAGSVRQALTALAQLAHEHRTASAELALTCGRTIAGAALEQFPEAPIAAALEALSREIEAEPRLVVKVQGVLTDRIAEALDRTAKSCGFPGHIIVKGDPAMPAAAFSLDWGDGRATFDPVDAAARVQEALQTALAAEGLHAEPLLPNLIQPGDI